MGSFKQLAKEEQQFLFHENPLTFFSKHRILIKLRNQAEAPASRLSE